MKNKYHLSTIIATIFGLGFIKFAPGTIGSLVAIPFYFLLNSFFIMAKGGVESIASIDMINTLLAFFVGLSFVAVWAIDRYTARVAKDDPKEVIIDEFVGQSLAICWIIFLLPYLGSDVIKKFIALGLSEQNFLLVNIFSAFILFRFFDIIKPWPINYIDQNMKNSFGVIFDDILAAVFACIFHYFIIYAIADRII